MAHKDYNTMTKMEEYSKYPQYDDLSLAELHNKYDLLSNELDQNLEAFQLRK